MGLKATIKNQESQMINKITDDTLRENLIGFWFTPHAAMVNMKFDRKGNFIFNDYNTNLEKMEELTGNYEISGTSLTLYYDDRPKQKFRYKQEVKGDHQY